MISFSDFVFIYCLVRAFTAYKVSEMAEIFSIDAYAGLKESYLFWCPDL